ncbi:hypothetical protein [Leptothermofonsia sp. ETS-13]|uniref:hypothetical protein n=1 Tax=Leptothermofonsia sp. ETS-13 TaxID=3035696 RepID=UPI003BA1E468
MTNISGNGYANSIQPVVWQTGLDGVYNAVYLCLRLPRQRCNECDRTCKSFLKNGNS